VVKVASKADEAVDAYLSVDVEFNIREMRRELMMSLLSHPGEVRWSVKETPPFMPRGTSKGITNPMA
jgi:hypothetical protein